MDEPTVDTEDATEHPGNYSVESKMKGIGVGEGQLFGVMEMFSTLILVVIT